MFKRYWWMLLVMVPVGAMAGFLIASVVTYVMPKTYESSTVIEVRYRNPMSLGDPGSGGQMPQFFFGTAFEKIKSRNSFLKVIQSLDLTNRWGVNEEAALQILRKIVTTENIRGTDLIRISVRHPNKVDARDIAAGVANAYKEYRAKLERESNDRVLAELKKAVGEQEDKIEKLRVVASKEKHEEMLLNGSKTEAEKRSELNTEIEILERLKLSLVTKEIENDIGESSVIVHDDPVISDAPVSPNVTLNLLIGLIGGALISPFFALPVMWMMNRRSAA